jgi:deoxyribodipyrimidine photo-lyase
LRFWVFSIRQIYNAWVKNPTFINELIWREFWQHIDYYFPECKKQEFQENKRNIKWQKNDFLFERWCEWKTWYPIIDACMKQLLETNRMHGRWRMIVASFLTKDLHIDWRLWEAFFKKHLLDYDENMNFWNWQWSASVWADPKPLRIFSPILQSQKFDSEAKFIKIYLPELIWQDLKKVHNPLENNLEYLNPIVDHRVEQKVARAMYK